MTGRPPAPARRQRYRRCVRGESRVVPGAKRYMAPASIKVGERLKVPWEGVWTCHEVRPDGTAVLIDAEHRYRFLSIAPKTVRTA